jgi:hypothetical protein
MTRVAAAHSPRSIHYGFEDIKIDLIFQVDQSDLVGTSVSPRVISEIQTPRSAA